MYILIDPSFFFINKISTIHDKWLSMKKPLSNNFYSCFFNSWSLDRAILYGAFEIGTILGVNSMLNSISLFGINLERLLRNTYKNSCITGVSFTPRTISSDSLTMCTKCLVHYLVSIFLALTLLIIMLRTWLSLNMNSSPSSKLNQTFFFI